MRGAAKISGILGLALGLLLLPSCDLNKNKEKKKSKRHSKTEMMVDSRSTTKPLSKKKGQEVSASSGKSGKVKVLSATANYRHLDRQGNCTYSPTNLTDGDKSTAFVIPTPGYVPLKLTFKLDGSKVRKIRIRNGYQKTNRTFGDHGRVGFINVYAYNGNDYIGELYSGDTYDVNGSEEFDLARTTDYYDRLVLEFPTSDLIPGDKYDELAISEIEFLR